MFMKIKGAFVWSKKILSANVHILLLEKYDQMCERSYPSSENI